MIDIQHHTHLNSKIHTSTLAAANDRGTVIISYPAESGAAEQQPSGEACSSVSLSDVAAALGRVRVTLVGNRLRSYIHTFPSLLDADSLFACKS
jgi:hypothetical protein